MAKAWRVYCHECGETRTVHYLPSICPVCGSGSITVTPV